MRSTYKLLSLFLTLIITPAFLVHAGDKARKKAAPAVTQYMADASHTQIRFKVRHLGIASVLGRFNQLKADVRVDPTDLRTFQANATIQVRSIDTGNQKRDNHLRSPDFFHADKYPTITFVSRKVKNIRGNTFDVEGDLTIKGVTRPITLHTEFVGEGKDPMGNRRIAFEAHGVINREDFGITWNKTLETGGLLVGKEVKLDITFEGIHAEDMKKMMSMKSKM